MSYWCHGDPSIAMLLILLAHAKSSRSSLWPMMQCFPAYGSQESARDCSFGDEMKNTICMVTMLQHQWQLAVGSMHSWMRWARGQRVTWETCVTLPQKCLQENNNYGASVRGGQLVSHTCRGRGFNENRVWLPSCSPSPPPWCLSINPCWRVCLRTQQLRDVTAACEFFLNVATLLHTVQFQGQCVTGTASRWVQQRTRTAVFWDGPTCCSTLRDFMRASDLSSSILFYLVPPPR